MKHKTGELEGALLDAAVAKAEGIDIEWKTTVPLIPVAPRYSISWAYGGPIIERERIAFAWKPSEWMASTWLNPVHYHGRIIERGPTPLIAAMRAYVASKLGEEVELP